jgi:hypothetical protein
MEQEIKEIVYSVLGSVIPLVDNPPQTPKHTYVLYRISNGSASNYKCGAKQCTTYLTFDIFSVYNGEKEVLELKEKIDEALNNLYTLDKTSYFTLSAFNIINEESPVKKHGILTYRILSTIV